MNNNTPYARFDSKAMILRDELALDRTLLANERTLLAYLRSALALLLAGGTILHLTTSYSWFHFVGYSCLPIGILAAIVGIVRFCRMQRGILILRHRPPAADTNN